MAATVAAPMTEQAYRALALTEAGKLVELWDGEPREKPAMSIGHNRSTFRLGYLLQEQLPWSEFEIRVNSSRLQRSARNYFIPDVLVVPRAAVRALGDDSRVLEVYDQPLPLVVEVWSPSTGGYDLGEKLAEYQRRGDEEIWYLHPSERTLTAWVRQADGRYQERIYRGGVVRPAFRSDVAIELGALFDV